LSTKLSAGANLLRKKLGVTSKAPIAASTYATDNGPPTVAIVVSVPKVLLMLESKGDWKV
jgi:hypothetical protein